MKASAIVWLAMYGGAVLVTSLAMFGVFSGAVWGWLVAGFVSVASIVGGALDRGEQP